MDFSTSFDQQYLLESNNSWFILPCMVRYMELAEDQRNEAQALVAALSEQ
jgi:hypothetical protein